MKNKKGLKEKLKQHLIKTVGKKPTKKEMKLVNNEIKPIFEKIYAHPEKMTEFVKTGYDAKLTKLWIPTVANESFIDELSLFFKFTRVKPDYKITSLASGLAVYELFLAREYISRGVISCIEASKEMNKLAKTFARKTNQKNIKILNASATNLPIKNDSQDVVLARRTGLSNDLKWGTVLNEAHRIIKKKKDSTFIFTVDKIFNKSLKEVKIDLKKANFEFITSKDFKRSKDTPLVSMIVAKLCKTSEN